MKLFKATLLLTALLAPLAPVGAQTVIPQPTNLPFIGQTLPGAIPTSLTCIIGPAVGCLIQILPSPSATDPYLCAVDLTATGQLITIQDGNGIPWIVGNAALGSAGNPAGFEWHASGGTLDSTLSCRVFPRGLYIVASASGVTGHLTFRYQK